MPEKTMPIGIVSTDTLRTDYLITKFESALWGVDPDKANKLNEEYKELFDILNSKESSPFCEPEEIREKREEFGYLLSDLHDALSECTPPFCYFGSAEGDGACFGCFFSADSWQEAVRCGEAVQLDDLSLVTLNDLDEHEYIGIGSDHGNLTIYSIARSEDGKKTSYTIEEVLSVV